MNILIKNCNLISMDKSRKKIEYGIDILIENEIIKKIDKNILIEDIDIKELKVIDATNKYILPGLINTHSHIGMSIFRESVDGYQTHDWLNKKIWPIEDQLTGEDVYYSTLLSCIEMIKTGTTTVVDQYFFPEHIIKAVLQSGVRCELTRVLMDKFGGLDTRYSELESLIKKYNGKYNNIYINIGIHGLYTASEKCVKKAISLAKKYNLNIVMHYLENSQEIIDIEQNNNFKKPYRIVLDNFKGVNSIFAHCVKLEDEDLEIMQKYNIHVAHCPISNLKLGCGIANVPKMIKYDLNVSLGTDGQGSGCNLDMFESMKIAGLLQKGINENPALLPAYEILKMATINGAKAMNKENIIGSIIEGKLADLIILDLSCVTTQPINDIFADIVYNVTGNNVETTIVGGKVLMENRKLIDLNESEIINNCKNILRNK